MHGLYYRQRSAYLLVAVSIFVTGCAEQKAKTEPVQERPADLSAPGPAGANTGSNFNAKNMRGARLAHEQKPQVTERAANDHDWFEDVTGRAKVNFMYSDGSEARHYSIEETVGGGVAMIDYDLDGDLDLFFCGGGTLELLPAKASGKPSAMFRNDGNWNFTDVTAAAGLDASELYTHGVAVSDYDRDGYPDLFETGYHGCRLYHNNKDGTFQEVSAAAGLVTNRWGTAAVWADYDRDGWPDLYIATYCATDPKKLRVCTATTAEGVIREACGPDSFDGEPDHLFRNRGDGTFEDVSIKSGIVVEGRGLGVLASDLDDNGWIDFFVANDMSANHLHYGGPARQFEEAAMLAGVAVSAEGRPEGSMGVDLGDFNGDGQIDMLYANYADEDNGLMLKVDSRGYLRVPERFGIAAATRRYVKFGIAFADFDSDGWLDFVVANGHAIYESTTGPYHQPAQMFRNEKGQRFVEISQEAAPYFGVPHSGRGVAIGDLDNDGATDVVMTHKSEPITLLRNRRPPKDWVRVALEATTSAADAVGAKLTMRFGDRQLTRSLHAGTGYLSQSDYRLLLPCADDKPVDVTVTWLGGASEVFKNLEQRQTHKLVEGQGEPVPGPKT